MHESSVWRDIWEGIEDLGRALKFWKWRKVRRADIPDDVRTHFEEFGKELVESGPTAYMNPSLHGHAVPDKSLGEITTAQRFAWIKERHDVAERREDRLETVEVAILLFLFLEVVHDYGPWLWRAVSLSLRNF